jgi:hypothetical protein
MSLFSRVQNFALKLVRQWWRPVTCIGIAAGAVVNLVVMPLKQGKAINLTEAAAFVTACAAAFAVREWGKIKGSAE